MSKHIRLEKKARDKILTQIGYLDKITKHEVKELMRAHYSFDIESLKEQDLGRAAVRLIAKYRDENGDRSFFNYRDEEGHSDYANIDKTNDEKALKSIFNGLTKRQKGINESRKKVERRFKEISGQISIDELNTD